MFKYLSNHIIVGMVITTVVHPPEVLVTANDCRINQADPVKCKTIQTESYSKQDGTFFIHFLDDVVHNISRVKCDNNYGDCSCNCTCHVGHNSPEVISSSPYESIRDKITEAEGCFQYITNPGNRWSCCIYKPHSYDDASKEQSIPLNKTRQSSKTYAKNPALSFENWTLALLCLLLSLSILILGCKGWRFSRSVAAPHADEPGLNKDLPAIKEAVKNQSILLMYASECEAFKETMLTLQKVLTDNLECEVIDINEEKYQGQVVECGNVWFSYVLEECNKIFVISSDAALQLQSSGTKYINENPFNRLQKYFFSQLPHLTYFLPKVLYVRFENFSPKSSISPLTTHTCVYTLPTDVMDLLQVFTDCKTSKIPLELHHGKELVASIEKLSCFKQEHPNYLLSHIVS